MKKLEQTKKQKGKQLENKVASLIRSWLRIKAVRMAGSGSLSHLKSDIYSPTLPFSVECKNTEKLNLWKAWGQARRDKGFKKPLLVYSSEFRPIMAILELEDLLDLIKELNDYKESN
jgi:hypothetical protein